MDNAYDTEEPLNYLYRREKFRDRIVIDPAVIQLNLKMPKLDGFEVLQTKKDGRI